MKIRTSVKAGPGGSGGGIDGHPQAFSSPLVLVKPHLLLGTAKKFAQ